MVEKSAVLNEIEEIRKKPVVVQGFPEWVSENIFIRPNILSNEGDKVDGHQHNFAHTTFVLTGAVDVKTFTKGGPCAACGGSGKVPPTPPEEDSFCWTCKGRGFDLVPGRQGHFEAPSHFLVRADTFHEISNASNKLSMEFQPNEFEELAGMLATASEELRNYILARLSREPSTFYCVYSHRDPQGRLSLVNHGWQEAYC